MAVDVGPPPSGGGPSAVALGRARPERSLLALRRGGWISAEQVAETQRAFLQEAVAEAVGELGYAGTKVREVIARAGVSRLTFYEHYGGVDECLLAALDGGHARVLEAARVGFAGGKEGEWVDQVRCAVVEVLALLDAQPLLARLCVLGAPTGPPAVVAVHRALIERLARGLRLAADRDGTPLPVSPVAARGLVGGAVTMVGERLVDPARQDSLLGLTEEVAGLLCGPFTAAKVDLMARAAPRPVRDWAPDVLRLDTASRGDVSRTILEFFSQCPGTSNTQLVEHLRASHTSATPATVSRRLAKMARDGLIVSTPTGGRHAWRLTEQGAAALASGAAA